MKVMISLATAAQQETEAFKKWFGKSKVVDAEGKPKRVYHGTSADFKEFDPKNLGHGNDENGIGFYFTDNPGWTEMYAGGEGGNVIPVYLKIQKPIYWDRQPEITETQVRKFMFYAGNKHVNQYLRDNFDVEFSGLSAARSEYVENLVGFDLVHASFSIFNDLYAGEKTQEHFAEIFKKVTGYDGVISQRHQGTNYVVFSPTQIKSAVGNAGTFRPRTADITK
jgi:hypothetical protein